MTISDDHNAGPDGPPNKRQKQHLSALEQYYDTNIRPLLDMVDKLRTLGITEEGVQLPSIVVVGDQSSDKSSVLESLASINLPRGQGIATRVPLVLRLQRCPPNEDPTITIEYGNAKRQILEGDIKSAVDEATNTLAGDGKGVIDKPISLHIRKRNAPDLTMIDLPGITRVPVHGQPDNIYEQISAMIHHYIQHKECVILNVLSATVDFSTCESIRMSQKEDKAGARTLAVVTKVDMAPEGLYEKVTVDAVNIGLGYVCVRNRADEEESHDNAREKEKSLFASHPALSKLDKDMIGISALAEKLTMIQANIIRDSLPGIVNKIGTALLDRKRELQLLPAGIMDELDAEATFLRIMMEKRTALERLVVHGDFQGYSNNREMHYPARLDELFQAFSDDLHTSGLSLQTEEKVLDIMKRTREGRGVYLPNFLNGNVFQGLVREQIGRITVECQNLVAKVHEYVQEVVFRVIDDHASPFVSMKSAYRRSAERVLGKARDECLAFVNREIDKESGIIHTVNDYYMENVRKIKEQIVKDKATAPTPPVRQDEGEDEEEYSSEGDDEGEDFSEGDDEGEDSSDSEAKVVAVAGTKALSNTTGTKALSNTTRTKALSNTAGTKALSNTTGTKALYKTTGTKALPKTTGTKALSKTTGTKTLSNTTGTKALSNTPGTKALSNTARTEAVSKASNDYQAAVEMRVSLVAYWKVVHKRLADGITFELRYSFQCALLKDLDQDVLREKASKGVSFLLSEDKGISKKRKRLQESVNVLEESYEVVSNLLKR